MALIAIAIPYFQGDLLKGVFSLRTVDPNTGKQSPYVIPSGAVVEVRFPGTMASVVIDSATDLPVEFGTGKEVVIVSAPNGDCSFTLIPTKGDGIRISPIGANKQIASQPINIVVLDSDASQLQTFEIMAGITCVARANP